MFTATTGSKLAENLKQSKSNRLKFIATKNVSVSWEAKSVDWRLNAPRNGALVRNIPAPFFREVLLKRNRNLHTAKLGKFRIIVEK